jgi:hypothetical protein
MTRNDNDETYEEQETNNLPRIDTSAHADKPFTICIGSIRDEVLHHGMSVSSSELADLVIDALELLAEDTDEERKEKAANIASTYFTHGEAYFGELHGASVHETNDEGEVDLMLQAGNGRQRVRIADEGIAEAFVHTAEQARDIVVESQEDEDAE